MIEASAPGKLFIVGEYAVVEPGQPAVLVAVDRYLRVRLFESATPVALATSPHVQAAITVIDELRAARGVVARHFEIQIESELDEEDGRKYGLGSSAAVTVATIAALDRLYELGLSRYERFKLALLATIEVSPRASGGDLAASTFGGWVFYCSPDRVALRSQREALGILSAFESELWQACEIRELPAPNGASLLVGWTGSPASTEQLVDSVSASPKSGDHDALRRAFLSQSKELALSFAEALDSGASAEELFAIIRASRALLHRLSEDRGIVIETDTLGALCSIAEQYGAAAKSSGAGGGDCGIALAKPENDIPSILRAWEQYGITHLDLEVAGSAATRKGAENDR
ncbi:phosphomevalonate kinase [Leucobacter sp. UT-8R-CII-1-4]|uniref:phosphomevalonate kinase n=1 Tax=Leucobacter sp. UT-8R-CII-1-4 TaxID=3040075 RepID=UPI0024A99AFC|nr:phosphomevalonate kinase [Leucobacter sp. UT-8R-CII-1-4]MDI6024597.1 phosphomevalonate kinase [Leucobacter sp. UT-8R-CII-1-4]